MLERYQKSLKNLERRNLRRRLSANQGIDFSSNDYLALSQANPIRDAVRRAVDRGVPTGAGASRLLRGNHEEIVALEAEAASFFGAQRALYVGGGYMANYALLTALPQRGDLVVYDALIHASSHDGMRAGKATCVEAAHNDLQGVEDAITTWRKGGNTGRAWILVESLYSMDGDQAPLSELMAIADRHEAFLLIDEAHATGVFGPEGRGLAAGFEGRDNVICLHTCGKALGAHGALICAPDVLCEYMVNRSRPFIYATAPSPLMAVAVRAALKILQDDPDRQENLQRLIAFANAALQERCAIPGSGSQIIPVVVGQDGRAMELAATLQAKDFDVRGIRPPTVPPGSARLRISLTLHVDEAQVASMIETLANELEKIA